MLTLHIFYLFFFFQFKNGPKILLSITGMTIYLFNTMMLKFNFELKIPKLGTKQTKSVYQ